MLVPITYPPFALTLYRRTQQGAEPDLSGITFRNGNGDHKRTQYLTFYQHGITSTRYVGVTSLCDLGLLEGEQWLPQNSNLTYVYTQNHPTYSSLTL